MKISTMRKKPVKVPPKPSPKPVSLESDKSLVDWIDSRESKISESRKPSRL
jgi:hypothetical protein